MPLNYELLKQIDSKKKKLDSFRPLSSELITDGNGRTARLLMNLILLHYGFPPAIIKVKDRVAYLDAIEAWQQQNDKDLFVRRV